MPKKRKISDEKELLPIKCLHEVQEVGGREVMTSFTCDDNGKFFLIGLNIAPMESAALFKCLSHINNLHIYRCIMEYSALRELVNLLKKDNKIKHLRIDSCGISDDNDKHVIDALENENCKVTHLDLPGNSLTAETARHLSEALKRGKCKLRNLSLDNNKLRDAGVEYLSDALIHENCKIAELNLNDNKLTDECVKYLSEALKSKNRELSALEIAGNELTEDGNDHLHHASKSASCKYIRLVTHFCLGPA